MIERLSSLSFGQPFWLLLLLLVPLVAMLQGQVGRAAAVRYSAVRIIRKISTPVRRKPGRWLHSLGLLALILCVIAMARPRIEAGSSPDKKQGVDIVFCVDVSGSMDVEDFIYQGMPISKRKALVMAIKEFVDKRPNDRFGMIGFAGSTYLMSPLTLDGEWIKSVLEEIQTKSQTAIGEGIVSSVQLLKESKSPSKVIVVVSDGANNAGIPPVEAAELARRDKIRIHSIEIMQQKNVKPDNAQGSMGQVAARTGGLYFQAASLNNIMAVYRQIDQMEKTDFEQKKFRVYDELFSWLIFPAFALFSLRWIGGHTLWLRVP